MNKTKIILMALTAIILCVSITACSRIDKAPVPTASADVTPGPNPDEPIVNKTFTPTYNETATLPQTGTVIRAQTGTLYWAGEAVPDSRGWIKPNDPCPYWTGKDAVTGVETNLTTKQGALAGNIHDMGAYLELEATGAGSTMLLRYATNFAMITGEETGYITVQVRNIKTRVLIKNTGGFTGYYYDAGPATLLLGNEAYFVVKIEGMDIKLGDIIRIGVLNEDDVALNIDAVEIQA